MLSINILIVDDDKSICTSIKKLLLNSGFEAEYVHTGNQLLKELKENQYDIILLDYRLPDTNAFNLLKQINEKKILLNTEVILMTAYGDTEIGMKAIKVGCFDYIAKPFNSNNLIFRIQKAAENIIYKRKVNVLSKSTKLGFENIIGNSKKMQNIYKLIKQIADKDSTVLIEGETGTGKELIAAAIFNQSKRNKEVFIPVNCGAIAETLLENELFGHEKGAYTGASAKKYGILEAANKGTVFLDEINNASKNVQIKLLRYLDTGEFIRVGGNKIISCNARILSASNQNLEQLVKYNTFREDLYHRLNVIKITLPPLRDRKEDIPDLVDFFLKTNNKKFNKKIKISKTCMRNFMNYNWPGNVRELKNLIHSLVLTSETDLIRPSQLPENLTRRYNFSDNIIPFKEEKNKVVSEFEINYLQNLLKGTKGNVLLASKKAGLNRKNLINKLKLYNIEPSLFKHKS